MNRFSASVAQVVALAALAFMTGSASAQPVYPVKSIRFIVPYAPGAGTDTVSRIYGQKLTEAWGQPVVVDNRPGANTVIGSEALAKAPPDGYTILLVVNTHAINPLLIAKLPYDPIRDFAPISTVAASEYMLAVHPSVPANTLQEFIAYAKARPGQLNYATSGGGGLGHLASELFNSVAAVKMMHVPYKGGAPSVIDLVAGQVQLSFIIPLNVIGHLKAGRLRGIAISGKSRLATLPDVPTFAEAGLPNFEARAWLGVLAPAAVPRAIIDKMAGEITRIQGTPDLREKLSSQGMDPYPGTPEQFAALIKADMDKFARIVKSANITLEN